LCLWPTSKATSLPILLADIAIGAVLLLVLAACTSKALVSDGLGLDRALAAAFFGAKRGETISLIMAQRQAAGDPTGCRWCRFLDWAVERAHCTRQLSGVGPTPLLSAARAGIALLGLLATLWAMPLVVWLAIDAAVRWWVWG